MKRRQLRYPRPPRPGKRRIDRKGDHDVAFMPPISTAFTQINLQHCKSASAVLTRCIAKLQTSIVLVQEPWLHKENISVLRTCGQCFSAVIPNV